MNEFINKIEELIGKNDSWNNESLKNNCLLEFEFGDDHTLSKVTKSTDVGDKYFIGRLHSNTIVKKTAYYGSCRIKSAENIIPDELLDNLDLDRCEFHSDHGLYVSLEGLENFLPWDNITIKPVLHIFFDSSGAPKLRLVRSLPSNRTWKETDYIPFDLLATLKRYKSSLSKYNIPFSGNSDHNFGNLPQWVKDEDTKSGASAQEMPAFRCRLNGFSLNIGYKGAPLSLQPTLLEARRDDPDTYTFDLIEGTDTFEIDYWFELKDKTISPEEEWEIPLGVIPRNDLQSVPKTPSSNTVLWIHGIENNEWLRVGCRQYAKHNISGETRRWPIAGLLGTLPELANISLWLDNSGPKILRAEFKTGGELKSLRLGIQDPMIELRLKSNAFFSDQSANNVLPDLSTLSEGVTLMGKPTTENAPIKLALKKTGTGSVSIGLNPLSTNCVYWVRPKNPLISPLEWSLSDPESIYGISSFRGLIPLENSDGFSVDLCKPTKDEPPITITPNGGTSNYHFPDFALGKKLLVASNDNDDVFSTLELEIDESNSVAISQRHALPHLDSFYARALPDTDANSEEANRKTNNVDNEALTWVKCNKKGTIAPISLQECLFNKWPNTLSEFGVVSVCSEIPDDESTKKIFKKEFGLFSVVWYPDRNRWSAIAYGGLKDSLGENFCLEVLGISVEEKELKSITFSIVPNPQKAVGEPFRTSKLTYSREEIEGVLFLDKAALSETYNAAEDRTINWRERSGGSNSPNIEFQGVESSKLSVTDDTLLLSDLAYWFTSEGIPFCVRSTDKFRIQKGRWNLEAIATPGMAISRTIIDGKRMASFKNDSQIAPGVIVSEMLLGDSTQSVLTLRCSDNASNNSISFAVRTSYLNGENENNIDSPAILRGGVYHIGWAGTLGTTSPNDIISGLTLGPMTRLFLQLERGDDGKLAASGMIGWECADITIDDNQFVENKMDYIIKPRATIYAHKTGEWSKLRLSGRWSRTLPKNEQGFSTIVLPRVDLDVTWHKRDESSISVTDDQQSSPILVEYLTKDHSNSAFCFQALSVKERNLSLNGHVRFVPNEPVKDAPLNTSTQRSATMVFSAFESLELQNNLELSDLGLPWAAIETLQDGESPLSWLMLTKKHTFDGNKPISENTLDVYGAFSGLTRINDSDRWLLCPVKEVTTPFFPDTTPKLWIFHEDGEDLIQLEGFAEKLKRKSLVGGADSKQNVDIHRKYAEEVLSFIRWRKPAVLEYWVPKNEGGPEFELIPVWSIVDAPLLNPFSSLGFMTPSVNFTSVKKQRDPGFVNVTGDLPTLPTKVPGEAEYDSGSMLITREIDFEKGPSVAKGNDVWLEDSANWSGVSGSSGEEGKWTSITPSTEWAMATPRPGERVSFFAETVWNKKASGTNALQTMISGVTSVTKRSDRRKTLEKLTGEVSGSTVTWPFGESIRPEELPIGESGLTLLIGSPNADRVVANMPFDLAIKSSDPPPENKNLVLQFTLSIKFRLDIEPVGSVNSIQFDDGGQKKHRAYVTFPADSYKDNQIYKGLIETEVETNTSLGLVEVFAVSAEPVAPFFKQYSELSDSLKNLDIVSSGTKNQPPTPTIVAILDNQNKLLAYGPGDIRYRIILKDESELKWHVYGEWQSHKDLTGQHLSVLLIR